jgi:hypothetical protein
MQLLLWLMNASVNILTFIPSLIIIFFNFFWQIILVVESVSAVLNHDRKLRKLSVTKLRDGNS